MNKAERNRFEREIGTKKRVGETDLAFKRRQREEGTVAGYIQLILAFTFFFGIIFLFAFASNKEGLLVNIGKYLGN